MKLHKTIAPIAIGMFFLPLTPRLISQDGVDTEAFLNQAAASMADPTLATEIPAAILSQDENRIRFYFISLEPAEKELNLYVREGNSAIPIRPAYDSFGSQHQLSSRRTALDFYQKVTVEIEGKEETQYQPIYRVPIRSGAPFAVIYQPRASKPPPGAEPSKLPVFDLSTRTCPYGKLTVFNPFKVPMVVRVDGKTGTIPAYKSSQHSYTVRRRGAGYVNLEIFRGDKGRPGKLLQTRVAMFEGSRGIGFPSLDSSGSGETGFLVHREMPQPEVAPE